MLIDWKHAVVEDVVSHCHVGDHCALLRVYQFDPLRVRIVSYDDSVVRKFCYALIVEMAHVPT